MRMGESSNYFLMQQRQQSKAEMYAVGWKSVSEMIQNQNPESRFQENRKGRHGKSLHSFSGS